MDVKTILNDMIFDTVKTLEFEQKPLHDKDDLKRWLRNKEAYINFIDGNISRLRSIYRTEYQDKPFYNFYLGLVRDVINEMTTIVGFKDQWTQSELIQRMEMLLTLIYSLFSACIGLGQMILFKSEYPLTPDDMNMYMEMKLEEKRTQRID